MGIFNKSDNKAQDAIIGELRQRVSSPGMPSYAEQAADRELGLLARTSPSTSEYTIGLTYIEYLLSLPWTKRTEDNLDLLRAERVLNETHYGLSAVKERVLEHLAVRTLIATGNPRVLVVDDEEIARKNLEHILKKEGYTTITAVNGADAFEKMASTDFDVVLTDLKMEKMDGMEVLEKTKIKYPDTRVIMITAHASVDTAINAMKKGATDYITKPFKLEDVRATVRQAVEKKVSTVSTKGPVLCFSGPPGTGKTSIGRAVADALGRKFVRISLGGIKDEAEIRGHRRTYAGAMPGRVLDEIRRAASLNPVIMLDEIDKIGADFKGDSASALLEALDPEQNRAFTDHYLDIPFDLSGVMFIATANVTDSIQAALLDRLEVIGFSGYTEDEKRNIGLHYLSPRQVREQGLSGLPPVFTPEAMTTLIQEYTREAGIRDLERQIAAVCRKLAMEQVKSKESRVSVTVTPSEVAKFLGPRKYYFDVADAQNTVGVTTGLVWTDAGGDIIFVEAAKMMGSKELTLTGSLGNVMRESARTALSYIRSNAPLFGIPDDFFEKHDMHIHVPAGAISKDGPSAGATIAVALISLLTETPARRDVAVSGELTLSGNLLPVGGVREKILAARRAGVKTVYFPAKNRADIECLPEDVKRGLEIRTADRIEDVVRKVLNKDQERPT